MDFDPNDPALQGVDPAILAQIQQRRAMGQQLLQTPAAQGRTVGSTYVAASPFEHLANAIRGFVGGKMVNDAQMSQQDQLRQQFMQRQAFVRALQTFGAPQPQAQQGVPPLLARPPDEGIPPLLARPPEQGAAPSQGNNLDPARQAGQMPRPQDRESVLLRAQMLARMAMLSGDPTLQKYGLAELENSRHLSQTEMDRARYAAAQQETGRHNLAEEGRQSAAQTETGRHNTAMEGIDRSKIETWKRFEGEDGEIFLLRPDTGQLIPYDVATGGSQPSTSPTPPSPTTPGAGAGSGVGPNNAPPIPTNVAPRFPPDPGEAPAPPAPATRAQKREAHKLSKLPADVRKQLDESTASLQSLSQARTAVTRYPGAFGPGEQPSDYLPNISIGGFNPLAPLVALTDAYPRMKRSPQEDEARAAVFQQAYEEIHRLAGAALSPGEAARLRAFLPNPNDSDSEISSKLENAEKTAYSTVRRLYAQYLPGVTPPPPPKSPPTRLRETVLRGGRADANTEPDDSY